MRQELARVRATGFAVLDLSDIRYIAAPIRGPCGRVVAALGAHAAPAQDLAAVHDLVGAAVDGISAAYGNAK
jgi:DNA-binding IclR family transcriptional regulator